MGLINSIRRILTTIAESDPTQSTYLSQLFHRRRYRVLILVLKTLSRGYIESLLDVGCGRGYLYDMLRCEGVEVDNYVCLDIDHLKLVEAYGLRVCADACRLPIATRRVKYVVVSEVLEHLRNPLIALNEILRVAEKYVIITFPDERIKDSLGFRYPEHVSRVNVNEVLALANRRGFGVVTHLRLGYLIPPSIYDKFLPYNNTLLKFLEILQKNLEELFMELCLIKTEILVLSRMESA